MLLRCWFTFGLRVGSTVVKGFGEHGRQRRQAMADDGKPQQLSGKCQASVRQVDKRRQAMHFGKVLEGGDKQPPRVGPSVRNEHPRRADLLFSDLPDHMVIRQHSPSTLELGSRRPDDVEDDLQCHGPS